MKVSLLFKIQGELFLTFQKIEPTEGHFTHWKKRTRFFSGQKDLYGFLMNFSLKQKDFCQRCTRFLGVKCPSEPTVSYEKPYGEQV